jgi:hypothetical protein
MRHGFRFDLAHALLRRAMMRIVLSSSVCIVAVMQTVAGTDVFDARQRSSGAGPYRSGHQGKTGSAGHNYFLTQSLRRAPVNLGCS